MEIEKFKSFAKNLFDKMRANPKEAFDFFKLEWPKFNVDERTIAFRFINEIYLIRINGFNEAKRQISQDEFLYWQIIEVYMQKPVNENGEFVEEEEYFGKLILNDSVNYNEIAKIFKILKQKNYILSTKEQIAEAISLIFPIEYSTALKDLSEEKRTKNAKNLIC